MEPKTKSQGLDAAIESYSGLLTVDAPNNGNMFFWFFPAAENPETAPVVIWLQVSFLSSLKIQRHRRFEAEKLKSAFD